MSGISQRASGNSNAIQHAFRLADQVQSPRKLATDSTDTGEAASGQLAHVPGGNFSERNPFRTLARAREGLGGVLLGEVGLQNSEAGTGPVIRSGAGATYTLPAARLRLQGDAGFEYAYQIHDTRVFRTTDQSIYAHLGFAFLLDKDFVPSVGIERTLWSQRQVDVCLGGCVGALQIEEPKLSLDLGVEFLTHFSIRIRRQSFRDGGGQYKPESVNVSGEAAAVQLTAGGVYRW